MGTDTALVDPRPIALGSGSRAVVLIHGLTGTPYEVKPMAEALHASGFMVRAPLLAGHSDLEELEASTWRDWYGTAEGVFLELREHGCDVVVLGFSLGGLLALRLAALHEGTTAGAVAISVPLELPSLTRRAILTLARLRRTRLIGDLVGMLPKDGPDVRIQREFLQSPSLRGLPYPTLAELVDLQADVSELLPHVRVPLLLLHGRYDHTAPVEMSERIAQRVSSSDVRRIVLPRSFHIVGLDLDREQVCREVVAFAHTVLGDPHEPTTTDPTKETQA